MSNHLGSPLFIVPPTITVDDLRRFHEEHFPNASVPSQLTCYTDVSAEARNEDCDFNHELEGNDNHDDDDDGLGYYADGTKRTLTDKEIAFLRYSEVQRLLREERRKQEVQAEEEEGEPEVGEEAEDESYVKGDTINEDQEEGQVPDSQYQDHAISTPVSPVKFDIHRNKSAEFTPYGSGSKKHPLHMTGWQSSHSGDHKINKKKRKKRPNHDKKDPKYNWKHWDDPGHGQARASELVHQASFVELSDDLAATEVELMPRRVARELDAQSIQPAELDYG